MIPNITSSIPFLVFLVSLINLYICSILPVLFVQVVSSRWAQQG